MQHLSLTMCIFFLVQPFQSGEILLPLFLSLSASPSLTFLHVHYSYSRTISVHHDELWAPQPKWCIGVRGGSSSLLRDSFNCHSLLCSPTATNTISLNNLVFVGRDVLRSCLLIFAYRLGECDEKNDSLYVLYFIEEEAGQSIRTVVDSNEKRACKWTELFRWILSPNLQNFLLPRSLDLWPL